MGGVSCEGGLGPRSHLDRREQVFGRQASGKVNGLWLLSLREGVVGR